MPRSDYMYTIFLNISFKLFCLVKSVALLGSPRLGYYLTLTDLQLRLAS
uniref:Uncharacterized protein n=1 Tax=Anguilla anguilla TaxID=7936 RepID=A0A0E9RN47_ANGAN